MTQLSCAILAGGRSRRMGQDKALLKLPDGQVLLGRTVGVARSLLDEVHKEVPWQGQSQGAPPDITVVTPWPERYQSVLTPPIQWVDDRQAAGPLAGFSQAWSKIQSDWCLLLACDLPKLEAQALQQWWQWLAIEAEAEAETRSPSAEASLIKRSKGWEPLCGYYHRSCVPSLTKHLSAGHRDFQSWLQTLNIAPYSAMPAEMLFNCNRPADWAKISE